MIKSKEEYYSILERLRTMNFNQKLGRNLQAKLEAFEEMEELVNLTIPVVMPRSLTAENGAKDLLRGEFVECFDPDNSGNPYIVPISWDSIKNIYKRIVEHYVA